MVRAAAITGRTISHLSVARLTVSVLSRSHLSLAAIP